MQSDVPGSRKLGQSYQIFAPETALRDITGVAPLRTALNIATKDMGAGVVGATPWIISIQSIEIFREGAPPYRPLQQQEIIERGSRFSVLQAQINWQDGTGGQRHFFVDIAGGVSIHMFAQNVTVNALIPAGSILVDGGTRAMEAEIDGPAFDAVVSARIAPTGYEKMESTVGYNYTVQVDNDGSLQNVPIPPGAREVSIFQGSGAPTAFYEYGGTLVAAPKGRLLPDAFGNVDKQSIPNVPYIRIPADPGVPRFYSFVFRVYP